MKVLLAILVVLVIIVAVVVGIAFTMPAQFSLQDSAVIAAPPETLYVRFATPRTWARWSAWTTEKDPTLAYTYPGADSGVGAIMKWTSKAMGFGQLEIVEVQPGRMVHYPRPKVERNFG